MLTFEQETYCSVIQSDRIHKHSLVYVSHYHPNQLNGRFTARVASWETLSGAPASEKTGIFPATQQEPKLLLIGQFIHVTSLAFT